MLNYMDFATSAGLHFIGHTEGNLTRIHDDLVQMNRGQKVSFGIMSLQKRYLTELQSLSKELGKPFAGVLERLKEITEDKSEVSLRARPTNLSHRSGCFLKRFSGFLSPTLCTV